MYCLPHLKSLVSSSNKLSTYILDIFAAIKRRLSFFKLSNSNRLLKSQSILRDDVHIPHLSLKSIAYTFLITALPRVHSPRGNLFFSSGWRSQQQRARTASLTRQCRLTHIHSLSFQFPLFKPYLEKPAPPTQLPPFASQKRKPTATPGSPFLVHSTQLYTHTHRNTKPLSQNEM